MKKVFITALTSIALCFSSPVFSQEKVVVVPLNSSKSENVTIVYYAGSSTDNEIDFFFHRSRVLGSFTKKHDNTGIMVHWLSQVEQTGSPGNFVQYNLRLNGQAGIGLGGSGCIIYNNVDTHHESFHNFAYWTNLPAGSYDVEVWIRGNATSTTINNGNFEQFVLVEEINANTEN